MKYKIFIGLVVITAISIFGIRLYHEKEMVGLVVLVPEKESPLDTLDIQKLEIPLSDRKLAANFLKYNDQAPAIFICTGNGEALYEWLPVQKYLLDHGYSSFIFSYAGFGNSTGKPTTTSLFEDAEAAYAKFIELTPDAKTHVGMSHSLGGTPLLGIVNSVNPAPDKIIVHAAYSSLRQLLVDLNMVSYEFLWPNLWDNMSHAAAIDIPILYVHSKDDKTVPYRHSESLLEATGDNSSLLLIEGFGHNAIYQNLSDSLYQPIFRFIEK